MIPFNKPVLTKKIYSHFNKLLFLIYFKRLFVIPFSWIN